MKKMIMMTALLFSTALMATNDLSIVPAADVHDGQAGNGTINAGVLDVSGMADGSQVCFDVVFENIDFNLAGYQFEVNFPANLLSLSTTAGDWQAGTGAVVIPGALIGGLPLQQLPADDQGDLTAATALENGEGKKVIGVLFTDPANRLQGSQGAPNAGGVIARVCFNLTATSSCTSTSEDVSVTLSSTFNTSSDDIFANDAAERVVVGSSAIVANFGNSSAFNQRGDADGNGSRGLEDVLLAARCVFFGKDSAECNSGPKDWANASDDEFNQTFDYDCSGTAGIEDVLGIARLAFGINNRSTLSKRAESFSLAGAGELNLDYENTTGAVAFGHFDAQGFSGITATLSADAKDQGWILVSNYAGGQFKFLAMNPTAKGDMPLPVVRVAYEAKANGGVMTWRDNANFDNNSKEFAYVPVLLDSGQAFDGPARERTIKK